MNEIPFQAPLLRSAIRKMGHCSLFFLRRYDGEGGKRANEILLADAANSYC